MPEKLDSLLQKIQDEAVTSAEEKANVKIAEAEKKVDEIISNAQKKAQDIVEQAESKAKLFAENGEKSLEQAARDLLIYLRKSINRHFDAIYKKTITEIMPIEKIQEILIKLATDAKEKGRSEHGVNIFLSEKDYEGMAHFFINEFHNEVKQGATFHPLPSIKQGFRICISDKNVQYDFTDEVIVNLLRELVNPTLDKILKTAVNND